MSQMSNMLNSTQSTSSSICEAPTPEQRRRSPSTDPPAQDSSNIDGNDSDQYATMNDLHSVVDTLEKMMEDQFGATRQLLQGIEQSQQADDLIMKDALSRVEKQLASQEEKLEHTIETLKQSINSSHGKLAKRIQGLEALIMRAEEGFMRLENALTDDVITATTAPATPTVETERTLPLHEAGMEPPTSDNADPSNATHTAQECTIHPSSRTPSSGPEPTPATMSGSGLDPVPGTPNVQQPVSALGAAASGARPLRRETTFVGPKNPITSTMSPRPMTRTGNSVNVGFTTWAGKEVRPVPAQTSGSGTATEVSSATDVAAEDSKKMPASPTVETIERDEHVNGPQAEGEEIEAGGQDIATSSKKPSVKRKQSEVRDMKQKSKRRDMDSKTGEDPVGLAAASSSDASAAVGSQGESSPRQTNWCAGRPTTRNEEGFRRSLRKRGHEDSEEPQPVAPPTQEPSKMANKRRKGSNRK
ncbi:hypothetical protein OE88DRAFT_1726127 [Heliocybe sulcata]|uniref:Uncharacterized protein n=1 Tax=Heliocybe sulcata TaxID=5364 RepID=A0A5C3N0Q0_9AGAM|nr:hypothetical protein OE88DRAFT_1726127 [Heliocybe sulcata]